MSSRTLNLDDKLYQYILANSVREHPAQIGLRERRRLHEADVLRVAPTFRDETEFPNRHEVLPNRRGVTGMIENGQQCVGGRSGTTTSSAGSRARSSSGCAMSCGRNCGP